MTDKEKLQRLFDAALKDTSELNKAPTRAFPSPVFRVTPVPAPVIEPILASMPVAVENIDEKALVVPLANAALHHTATIETGALSEEPGSRLKRSHVRQAIATLAACLALTGGGYCWFIQSLTAKHQASQDRIAARSPQTDPATDTNKKSGSGDTEDRHFDAETQELKRGGRTVDPRSAGPRQSFDSIKNDSMHTTIPVSKPGQADSSEWSR